jgi:type IV fimbrial biogenesis protein FimT
MNRNSSTSRFSDSRHHQQGFTVIELLMVIAIMAIVMTIAVPSYTTFVQNNRLTSQLNTFVTSVNLARSESVKRSVNVVMCKSADQAACTTNSTGWQQGWIVFADADSDNSLDSGETILRVSEGFDGGNTLVGESGSDVRNFIAYQSNGVTTFPAAVGEVELVLCDERADDSVAKAIAIAPTGRVQSMYAEDSSLSCSS